MWHGCTLKLGWPRPWVSDWLSVYQPQDCWSVCMPGRVCTPGLHICVALAGLGQGHLAILGRALLRDGVVRLHALDSIFSSPKWGLSLGKSPDCPGSLSAIELSCGTKVAYGQGTVNPIPTQVPSARCTELTLHKIEGPDILQHSIFSRSSVRALLQRNLNRTIWKELISTTCLCLSYINTLMYDRPWLSVRNRYSTNFVYNCDTALLWRNLNRSITQELILNNHLSKFASWCALLRQSLNCIILKELTLHNPLSIYVSPLALLRWTRTAPYNRNCYSTTNFVPT